MEKGCDAGFDTLERLRSAVIADISSMHGLGEITASVIVDGIKECIHEMDAVLKEEVITIALPPPEESLPLRGLSFCFTGELNTMKRGEAEEKIKSLGAQAKSTVVKGLSYLVTNDTASGSAKNKKARELKVEIIDEEQFIALLESNTGKPKKKIKADVLQGELF
jgi:DNA ligase (NAD+)